MTKPLTEAEVKAEILDLSPELITAIIKRVEDSTLLNSLRDLIAEKLGFVDVYTTAAEYRLERFNENMEADHGSEFPQLTEAEVFTAMSEALYNYEAPDSLYEDVTDIIDEALDKLHREKFPEWWAKQESDSDN